MKYAAAMGASNHISRAASLGLVLTSTPRLHLVAAELQQFEVFLNVKGIVQFPEQSTLERNPPDAWR